MSHEERNQEVEARALDGIRKLTKALAELPAPTTDDASEDGGPDGETFALYCCAVGIRVKARPLDEPEGPVDDLRYLAEISARANERGGDEAAQSPKILFVGAIPLGSDEASDVEEELCARAWRVPLPSGDEDEKDPGPTPIDMINDLISDKMQRPLMTTEMKMYLAGTYAMQGHSVTEIASLMDYSERHIRRLLRGWREKEGAEYLQAGKEIRTAFVVEAYENADRLLRRSLRSDDLSPLERAELVQMSMRLAFDFGNFLGK